VTTVVVKIMRRKWALQRTITINSCFVVTIWNVVYQC